MISSIGVPVLVHLFSFSHFPSFLHRIVYAGQYPHVNTYLFFLPSASIVQCVIYEGDWYVVHLRTRALVCKIKCGRIEETTGGIWPGGSTGGDREWTGELDVPAMVEMSEKAGVPNKAKEK